MIDNNLQFQDFHMRNWNSQRTVLCFEPNIPQTIFSGLSCAPEICFLLPMVLLGCNLIQDHAVWISSRKNHAAHHLAMSQRITLRILYFSFRITYWVKVLNWTRIIQGGWM